MVVSARIILAALVAPAEVQENQPALDLLWHVRFRWKLRPRQITGDTKYGTVANLVAIEDQRIHAYMPLSEAGHRPGVFQEQDFTYDAAADTYHCPGGQTLRFLSQCDTTRRRIYQAPAAACTACVLRTQCTTSRRGRRISRSLDADTLERVRGYHQTESYATAMRKRRVWVEPLFAEAKDWHGLRRFRLRGCKGEQRGTDSWPLPEPEALARREGLGPAPRPLLAALWPARKPHGRWQPSLDDHWRGKDAADLIDQILIKTDDDDRRLTFSTGWAVMHNEQVFMVRDLQTLQQGSPDRRRPGPPVVSESPFSSQPVDDLVVVSRSEPDTTLATTAPLRRNNGAPDGSSLPVRTTSIARA